MADKLGISNRTVCKWERGRGTPKFTTLLALAALFGVSLDELVGNKSVPEK